jgi:hypothetical protein
MDPGNGLKEDGLSCAGRAEDDEVFIGTDLKRYVADGEFAHGDGE